MKKTKSEILKSVGDPLLIREAISAFRRDTDVLSSKKELLLEKYPQKWIAIFHGEVKVVALTLPELLSQGDKLNIPRDQMVVQYIDGQAITMIL